MELKHISAVTLAVRDMAESVKFYRQLGLTLVHGGEQASFSSLQAGDGFINLILVPDYGGPWWGRVILRTDDADSLYRRLQQEGLEPGAPRTGEWGERYFHLSDPNGHELSFAELIS